MKNFLSKLVCLIALVSFFGCSTENTDDNNEEKTLNTLQTVNEDDSNFNARPSAVITLYIECDTYGPFTNNCLSDLGLNFTIISSTQSTICSGIIKVIVDRAEFNAFFGYPVGDVRNNHLLRPPFNTSIPVKPSDPNYYSNCFPTKHQ